MKPALLADWDLSHVLAQLNQAQHTSTSKSHSNCVFKETPDPANINEYHIGIAGKAGHLEFKCGEFVVSHEGTGLRAAEQAMQAAGKDEPKVRLAEQWWCSSEAAVAAIKKVARQESEEKDRSKQEAPKSLSAHIMSSGATAAKKALSLAAGSMTLGKQAPHPFSRLNVANF